MATTKRPQNKCKSCGYTWYPRGKYLSIKCPNCGSSKVSTVSSWSGILIIGLIAYGIFGDHQKPTETTQTVAPTIVESQQNKSITTQINNSPIEHPQNEKTPEPEVQYKPNIQENIETTKESHLTPTILCKDEDNFFSKNNCIWKECEKPEFSSLEECANKKPKENSIENSSKS